MTLLIGANLGSYTILAADTRVSWFHGLLHKDGNHKIAKCQFGLITGSGYVDALEAVKKELLKKTIEHTDQILGIINTTALPLLNQLLQNYPNDKSKTCFLITYATQVENSEVLRLALLHPSWEYKLAWGDKTTVVMPGDSGKEDGNLYLNRLNKELLNFEISCDDNREFLSKFFDNFIINIKCIARCFDEISLFSKFVSKDMDYAITLKGGMVIYGYGLSSELKEGRNFRFSIIGSSCQTRFLTPEIFKEGEQITAPPTEVKHDDLSTPPLQ